MVDYNSYAKTFSNSRKSMKWEEIEYFLSYLKNNVDDIFQKSILDIWCWNGRLLWELKNNIELTNYLGVDLSEELLKEAKKIYPENNFLNLNMLELEKLESKFDIITFIASFHHLKTIEERVSVLEKAFNLLNKDWIILFTNWALGSELNFLKYKDSIIKSSENEFWSVDYDIKIWKFTRFYHYFSLKELEYLFKKTWFRIVENKLFKNQRNNISIITK